MRQISVANVLYIAAGFLIVKTLIGKKETPKTQNITIAGYSGYYIANCKELVVKNAEQALSYAVKVGSTSEPEQVYIKLFGSNNCFDTLDANSLRKAYELLAYAGAAGIAKNDYNLESVVTVLDNVKNHAPGIKDFPPDSKEYVLSIKIN